MIVISASDVRNSQNVTRFLKKSSQRLLVAALRWSVPTRLLLTFASLIASVELSGTQGLCRRLFF